MTRVIRTDGAGARVVPAVVVDAHERARQLLAQAHARALAISAGAVEQGRTEGRAELASALLEYAHEHAQALAALERQALELALLGAKRIVGEALALEPQRIAEIVAPLLARLRRARHIAVHVHPEDRAQLQTLLAGMRERAGVQADIQIEIDAALSRGGCVVKSDIGTLDARVETRLDALARALEHKLSTSATETETR